MLPIVHDKRCDALEMIDVTVAFEEPSESANDALWPTFTQCGQSVAAERFKLGQDSGNVVEPRRTAVIVDKVDCGKFG